MEERRSDPSRTASTPLDRNDQMRLYDESQLRRYAYNQIQLSSFLDQIAGRVLSLEAQLAQITEHQYADSITRTEPVELTAVRTG
jgi:hypothetical protein